MTAKIIEKRGKQYFVDDEARKLDWFAAGEVEVGVLVRA